MEKPESQMRPERPGFWEIVENFEVSQDTLALTDAAKDQTVEHIIEWQYKNRPEDDVLYRQYRVMSDHLTDTYDLPLRLCEIIYDYHHAKFNDNYGLIYGEA